MWHLCFFAEALIIGILAIVTGIFVGTLFSQVIISIALASVEQ